VEATGAFRDEAGHLVPHLHNWHSLNFYPDTILARGRSASPFLCPVVDARGRLYWVITGGRLCAIEADGGVAYAQRLSSAVMIVLTIATALLVLAAPLVISLYTGPEFRSPDLAPQRETMVLLARFTLLQVFFYGLYTLLGQMLNARGRFGPMMFAPVLNNLIAIAVFGLFFATMGAKDPNAGEYTTAEAAWFGLGSTVGIAAQALILLPVLWRTGLRLKLRFDLRGVGLGKAFRLGGWTVGLIGLMQLTQVVVVRLATGATALASESGAVERGAGIAVYNNAFLIIMVPHSIITVSLATALLPNLSRTAAAQRAEEVRAQVLSGVRTALAIIIPFAGLLLALAGPISRLLFGYGAASEDTDLVAVTLAAFLPGLVGFTSTYLLQRAFYAAEDTRTPFVVQLVVSGVQVALSLAIVPRVNPVLVSAALAAAWSVAVLIGALTALVLTRRRFGPVHAGSLALFVLLVVVAALPGSLAALWLVLRFPEIALTSAVGALLVAAVGTVVAATSYVVLAWAFRVAPVRDGLRQARALLAARLGRR
jgi:murein biosynthesis integral membrane protein MurJ